MSLENVNIQVASSMPRRRMNPDGSLNVYCRVCRNFICAVDGSARISSSAICAVCEAFERGEVMTQVQEDEIRVIRMVDGRELPKALFVDKPDVDPVTGAELKDRDSGLITGNTLENFFRVLRRSIKGGIQKPRPKKIRQASAALAKEKKPRSVLSGGLIFTKDEKTK